MIASRASEPTWTISMTRRARGPPWNGLTRASTPKRARHSAQRTSGAGARVRASRPPARLAHRRPELSRPSRLRELVEAEEDVADAHLADRPPRHVGVQDRRVGLHAVGAAMLATPVRVQAEAEADVG